jgi:hypothetical protein
VLIEATETLQQQQLLTPRSQEQQQQQHDGRPVSARQEPDGAAGGASGTAAALAAGGEEYAHTTHLPAGEGARGSDPALLEHPESHHAHVRRARHLMQVRGGVEKGRVGLSADCWCLVVPMQFTQLAPGKCCKGTPCCTKGPLL